MVEDRITDGRRIAELLASEIDGREDGELASVSIENADPDVEPTTDGARAYDVDYGGVRLARAFVHTDRVRLAFEAGSEAAAGAAEDAGLRVRPTAPTPATTLVFVEDGADVKRATNAVRAGGRALEDEPRRRDGSLER